MTTRTLLVFLVLGSAVVVGACGGTEDDRDPVWGYISPVIIQPNCATSSCHSALAAVAGLDLSTAEAGWHSLRELKLPRRMMPVEKARPMVTPFNPDQSRLVNMLRATGARRMPPDRPLPEADIALIEHWILNGAVND